MKILVQYSGTGHIADMIQTGTLKRLADDFSADDPAAG
jgi:hypothetical protein